MFNSRSSLSSSVRTLALAVAAVPLLINTSGRAETVRIAMTGEAAPGGGTFTDFGPFPVINSAGQVGFDGFVSGVGSGVYRSDFGGLTVPIARAGDAAPDGGTYSSASFPLTTGTGDVVFFGTVGRRGIFRSDGLSSVGIVLEGDRAPGGGEFSHIPGAVVNEGGGVAFHALTTTVGGVFYGDGETLHAFARGGDRAPGTGGGVFDGAFFTMHDVNASGFVSFQGETPTGSGIFRGEGPGKVTAIGRIGDPAPGGGTFFGFDGSRINASGRVAFRASRVAGSSLPLGLYHGAGAGDAVVVVEEGGEAPGGGRFVQITSFSEIAFNDANEIAFRASTTTTDGVFRGDGTALQSMAREDESSPDGNGRFAAFGLPSIARGGQVFFATTLRGTAGGVNDDTAFILTDGIDRVVVAREGQFRDGSTLATFEVTPGERSGSTALNDGGQVVYGATLADGRQGRYVFTPDLHWRSRESGAWQTDGAWTLSLRPDAPHRVFIDPQGDLTVTGPSSRTTIRRLDVGSPLNDAKATLSLSAGGELAVSDTVTVHSDGVIDLRDGVLTATTVFNDGLVHVDGGTLSSPALVNRALLVYRSGTITGNFTNTGLLRVDGNLSAFVNNSGELVINAGGLLDAGNSVMVNTGALSLKGGTWSASAIRINTGAVTGHGALGGSGQFVNHGLLSVPGGTLVSTGGIVNNAAVELSPAGTLHMGGGQFENRGTLSLNGGILTGGFSNATSGTVLGPGTLGDPSTNQGTILLPVGTLSLFSGVTNDGLLHLQGASANVTGGAIINNGTIQGAGRIANSINNLGTIEPLDGTLTLAGTVSNLGPGLIAVPAGAKVLVPGGIASNFGSIAFDGGTFDGGSATVVNSAVGRISGSGTLRSGGLQNSGVVGFSAGTSSVFGPVTNTGAGKVIVSGKGQATFHSPVTNEAGAELRVSDGATAVFFGNVTNNGTITGGGDKFFEGGVSAVGALATTGTSAVAAPATLNASHVRERSLSVRGKVVISPNGGPSGTSVLDALDVQGEGSIDLTDNDMILHATAATRSQRVREVEAYVAAGRNANPSAGRWRGAGLASSAAAANPLTALAVGVAGDDVVVKYSYNGDANLDGRINADDYFRIDPGFLAQPSDPLYFNGDFNYDGRVNADDYFLIDQAFLGQGAPLDGGDGSSPTLSVAVPEPGAAWLLLPFAAVGVRRSRRTRAAQK
jgi:hypothetical protein